LLDIHTLAYNRTYSNGLHGSAEDARMRNAGWKMWDMGDLDPI